jgi:hypothetical protein
MLAERKVELPEFDDRFNGKTRERRMWKLMLEFE